MIKEESVIGIDVGSSYTKLILRVKDKVYRRLSFPTPPEGVNEKVEEKKKELIEGIEDEVEVIVTGYGRRLIKSADKFVSEIIANAQGIRYLYPDIKEATIVDIGGQDTKAIALDKEGRIKDFAMNDRCAAGCGKALEILSCRLGISKEEFHKFIPKEPDNPKVELANTCVVFMETEIISLLSQGEDKSSILWALCFAVAKRIISLLHKVGISNKLIIDGGVANNIVVRYAIESIIKKEVYPEKIEVYTPCYPEFVVALGATL